MKSLIKNSFLRNCCWSLDGFFFCICTILCLVPLVTDLPFLPHCWFLMWTWTSPTWLTDWMNAWSTGVPNKVSGVCTVCCVCVWTILKGGGAVINTQWRSFSDIIRSQWEALRARFLSSSRCCLREPPLHTGPTLRRRARTARKPFTLGKSLVKYRAFSLHFASVSFTTVHKLWHMHNEACTCDE